MEQALKITSVLSDPTRFYIYQYITKKHDDVTVQEIADNFNIHPNVARLHLTKLEDVNMLLSDTKKTGKGGRPSRLYRLSNEVIQLQFPFRDYQMLSQIALDSLLQLGEAGKLALYETGKKFGRELIDRYLQRLDITEDKLTFTDKVNIAKDAFTTAGLTPEFEIQESANKIYYQVYNCPFKEISPEHYNDVCNMHGEMMKGIFETLFSDIELDRKDDILAGCKACEYKLQVNQ
ncbi:helix-turn-helix transcriptional regulator [Ectobacillus polymachus]|uniref:helix-turn-helix transcriptional regulator n=1 Tax=Ectobacillus polymachus TaxID=1508806 RepID=UPI003A83C2BE